MSEDSLALGMIIILVCAIMSTASVTIALICGLAVMHVATLLVNRNKGKDTNVQPK